MLILLFTLNRQDIDCIIKKLVYLHSLVYPKATYSYDPDLWCDIILCVKYIVCYALFKGKGI